VKTQRWSNVLPCGCLEYGEFMYTVRHGRRTWMSTRVIISKPTTLRAARERVEKAILRSVIRL